jgi:plastocyanin
MRALPLRPVTLTVALAGLSLSAAPVAQGPELGTIRGHVTLSHVRGTALPSNAYSPRAVGTHQAPSTPEIKNVVVYLKGVTYRGPLEASHQQIVQENESFVPRVLAVTRGSTVDFPNADPVFHNVFSLSGAATFDLGRYPKGQSRARQFTKAGLVKVYCQIHSQMSASILVLDHPYFTVPDAPDGTFTIDHVPAGTYTIVGWHERVGERTARLQVQAGQTSSIEIALPVTDNQDEQ